jgi:uncharacterized protein
MGNPVVRWQILTPDPEGVARFYEKLFGWSVSTHNALGYREVATGGGGIGGGIWPAPPEAQTFVQLFIEVDSVDDALRRAQDLGASIIVPASALPDGDTLAILRDPAGLTFGLIGRAVAAT